MKDIEKAQRISDMLGINRPHDGHLMGSWLSAVMGRLAGPEPIPATPAPVSGAEWQLIETAPKEREIWAFNGEQARMIWSEGEDWALWIWADQLLSDADPSPDQPTHWMQLPQSPGAQPAPLSNEGGSEPVAPFGWAAAKQGNYFTRSKSIADRIGGLIPVYAAPQPVAINEGGKGEGVVTYPIAYVLTDADHMAKCFDALESALHERDAAVLEREESDGEGSSERIEAASETVSDLMGGMRRAIHEYRKRAERYRASIAAPQPSAKALTDYSYQQLFDAIAAATHVSAGNVAVSAKDFCAALLAAERLERDDGADDESGALTVESIERTAAICSEFFGSRLRFLIARIREMESRAPAEAEAHPDSARLDWCLSVLFDREWFVTNTGCGCCGTGQLFPKGTDPRAALDAVMTASPKQEES